MDCFLLNFCSSFIIWIQSFIRCGLQIFSVCSLSFHSTNLLKTQILDFEKVPFITSFFYESCFESCILAWSSVTKVKSLLRIPHPVSQCLVQNPAPLLLIQFLADVHSIRQQMRAPRLGPCNLYGKPDWVPSSWLWPGPAHQLQALGEWTSS